MKYTINITPKSNPVLVVTEREWKRIIKSDACTVNEDGSISLSPIIRAEKKNGGIEEFVKSIWMPLFPTHAISGSGNFGEYRVSGNALKCVHNMRMFFKNFNFDQYTVMLATCMYLDGKQRNNWKGTLKNNNFIIKELDAFCEDVMQDRNKAILKAKSYLTYVEQSERRRKSKRITEPIYESIGFSGGLTKLAPKGRIPDGGVDEQPPNSDIQSGGDNGRGDRIDGSGDDDGCGHLQPLKLRRHGAWGVNRKRE